MPDERTPDAPHGLRVWFGRVLDLLYPASCGVCNVPLINGRALCGPCGESLPRLAAPYCSTCADHFDGVIEQDFQCANCRGRKLSFEFARPALSFDERSMGLVHRLKYNKGLHVAGELGALAAEAFEDPRLAEALAGKWPLVPVPLHRSRLRRRHFNQADEIARVVARLTGLPVLPALKRVRGTETQTRLTRAQRLANLKGAFALSGSGQEFATAKPPGAIVLDDVFTTGSTVDECARILRRGGVQKVVVVTVMRG